MAKGFVDRVAARTTPELVVIYSASFEASANSEPKEMKILEDLMNAKAKAQKMLALVTAVHATSGPESSGQALLDAVREAIHEQVLPEAEKDN
eukprot:8271755-Heterocapsa_arctica.AAC.1